MPIESKTLKELREIVLWQQLNKQVIRMRDGDAAITLAQQKALQQFSFDFNLFHKLTEDPLIEPIPLALITNFSVRNIVTINDGRWARCLETLLKDVFVLDLELALADAFDAMTEHHRKYEPLEPESAQAEMDDDDALYDVINQYNELVERQRRQLPELLIDLYGAKATAIAALMDRIGETPILGDDKGLIFIDLNQASDKHKLADIYRREFCDRALEIIDHLTAAHIALKDMDLTSFFDEVESLQGSNPRIVDFIAHERELFYRQSAMINSFHKALLTWYGTKNSYSVIICDASPFAFLKKPFPEV